MRLVGSIGGICDEALLNIWENIALTSTLKLLSIMLRIVHLSDFHLNNKNVQEFENKLIPALIKDLQIFHKDSPVNVVIISGDLIDKGGNDCGGAKEGFQKFQKVVVDILTKALSISKERFFFTAGNHDIERNKDSQAIENGLTHTLVSAEEVNKKQQSENDDEGIKRIASYKAFEQAFYQDISDTSNVKIDKYGASFYFAHDGVKVGIASINSTWRAYNSEADKGKMLVGEYQISELYNHVQECDIKIAVMHHPIEHLAEFDKEAIEPYLQKFNVCLFGHEHKHQLFQKATFYSSVLYSMVPAKFSLHSTEKQYLPGYQIIDYPTEGREIVIHIREYAKNRLEFVANSHVGDNGIWKTSIPSSNTVQSQVLEKEVLKNLYQSERECWNSSLVCYNTDSNCPKNLEDIFIEPKLLVRTEIKAGSYIGKHEEKRASRIDKVEEEYTKVFQLLENDSNYLVMGLSETGKTVLLHKIAIDLCQRTNTSHIPVYIDFQDIGTSRIETIIAKSLRISPNKLSELEQQSRLLLLIDNIVFDERYHKTLIKVQEYFDKLGDRVKIIASYKQGFENDIPSLAFTEYSLLKFIPIQVKPFAYKQIRELTQKWLKLPAQQVLPPTLKKILKVLHNLHIPSTPLYASLLLWIYEKEKEPNFELSNIALTVQNFIERLFNKSSIADVKSQDFDYVNYRWLLSELAEYMLDNGTENYSVSYNDALSFVISKLKQKGLNFQANRLLDELILKGILICLNDKIKFRLGCFFSYYLGQKIADDSNFRTRLLKEDEYLKFIEEWEFYTALNRGDLNLLMEFTGRMDSYHLNIVKILQKANILTDSAKGNVFDKFFGNSPNQLSLPKDAEASTRQLQKLKSDQQAIDMMEDNAIETTNHLSEVQRKPQQLQDFQISGRQVRLVANTLRNLELIDAEVKSEVYKKLLYSTQVNVIQSNIIFTDIYNYIEHSGSNIPKLQKLFFRAWKEYTPALVQKILFDCVGGKKLLPILKRKIDDDERNLDVSELEKFLSIFLYVDLEGTDWQKYLKKYIKNSQRYIYPYAYLLLVYNYIFRSQSHEENIMYEGMLGDLIANHHNQRKQKGEIIQKIKQGYSKNKNENKEQYKMDFR